MDILDKIINFHTLINKNKPIIKIMNKIFNY